jgi:hypothetical protein
LEKTDKKVGGNVMSIIKYIKNQYIKPVKYYKMYKIPALSSSQLVDYFDEYDQWIHKLSLQKDLKILDIGSDYGSLYYYLKYHKFNVIKYRPYDYLIFQPFIPGEYHKLFQDYNFIKIDCEGCEFEIFKEVDINALDNNITYAIAVHKNEKYNEEIARKIQTFCPYKIFSIGFEDIYTNKISRWGYDYS